MVSPIVRIDSSAQAITNDDVITFDSAVRWLRAQGVEDDRTILEALQAAVNETERRCNRTFRSAVTRTVHYCGWMFRIPCPVPPLVSITNVKYYNTANTLTTVTSSDYSARVSTDNIGYVEFPTDYNFATLYADTFEPVQITMVTGFPAAQVPPVAKQVVRLLTIANYDTEPKHRTEAYRLIAGASLTHRG